MAEVTTTSPPVEDQFGEKEEKPEGYVLSYEPFSDSSNFGFRSNGRYVPWLVRRALKQLGSEESRCRLEVITSCSGIIEVLLSRKNIESIPPEIFDFVSLEVLRLDNNKLQLMDAHIGRLRSLRSLILGKNQLTSLPASLANCHHLVELDLQCNRFQSIPPCIWRLKKLTSLNFSWNQLTSISPDIARLKRLRYLNLEGNSLEDSGDPNNIHSVGAFPMEMVLLEHLEMLNIGDNNLQRLPPVICRLQNLRSLNLAGNKLSDLPPSLVRLEYLSELSLANNNFSNVPNSLSDMKSLRYLNISRNCLRVLPGNLALLDRLQILLASGNNLVAISDCLSHNLQVLDVSQNKLRTLCIGRVSFFILVFLDLI